MPMTKVAKFFQMIRQNGGIRGSLWKIYRTDVLKDGKFVGMDSFGNKYFENNRYFLGRNRWVEYNEATYLEFDASQVSAEGWHNWLHNVTDLLPCEVPCETKYKWLLPHWENLTATKGAYMPFDTTRPKIEAWVPAPQNK